MTVCKMNEKHEIEANLPRTGLSLSVIQSILWIDKSDVCWMDGDVIVRWIGNKIAV